MRSCGAVRVELYAEERLPAESYPIVIWLVTIISMVTEAQRRKQTSLLMTSSNPEQGLKSIKLVEAGNTAHLTQS